MVEISGSKAGLRAESERLVEVYAHRLPAGRVHAAFAHACTRVTNTFARLNVDLPPVAEEVRLVSGFARHELDRLLHGRARSAAGARSTRKPPLR